MLPGPCAPPAACWQALLDFKARIKKYEEVYEPIDDRSFHYIKLIDMVTGRGNMDVNRISGYIPGKLVFFLMQVRVGRGVRAPPGSCLEACNEGASGEFQGQERLHASKSVQTRIFSHLEADGKRLSDRKKCGSLYTRAPERSLRVCSLFRLFVLATVQQ